MRPQQEARLADEQDVSSPSMLCNEEKWLPGKERDVSETDIGTARSNTATQQALAACISLLIRHHLLRFFVYVTQSQSIS